MWTRRDTLKTLAACTAAYALPLPIRRAIAATEPDVEIRLTAAPGQAQIWKGAPTDVLRFTGEVLRGRPSALRASTSYMGPTLELFRGERVRIRFRNRTGEPSIVHWHGMLVPVTRTGTRGTRCNRVVNTSTSSRCATPPALISTILTRMARRVRRSTTASRACSSCASQPNKSAACRALSASSRL